MPTTEGGSGGAQGGSANTGEGGSDASNAGSSAGGMPVINPLPENDGCEIAVYDPASPPQALSLSGNLGVHDPVIMEQDGTFYLFATGNQVAAKTSENLMSWDGAQEVFSQVSRPSWVSQQVPGVSNLWAPDISYFGGQYHLFYSASTFGSNTSCIGHLTRASLSSGQWTAESEPTVCTDGSEDYNAIDPNVVVDVEGTPWLSFGSFWDGIRIIRLELDGQRADDEIHAIASRGGGAIEAPFIVRRCGYYYLFVSFDRCCQGADSTYNIRVGRSTEVLGPYEDRSGEPMLDGGGTLLVEGNDEWHGPGHNAVIFSGDRAYDIHHAYAASNGVSQLRISELAWDDDGWPISGGP